MDFSFSVALCLCGEFTWHQLSFYLTANDQRLPAPIQSHLLDVVGYGRVYELG